MQILLRAYALGVLQLGNVNLDGSKVHANASKHKAMSWDYANRLEEQLQAEVATLLQQAEAGNTKPLPGLKVADEIALRQARLQQIGTVKAELEARARLAMSRNKRPMKRSWPSGRRRNRPVVASWGAVPQTAGTGSTG